MAKILGWRALVMMIAFGAAGCNRGSADDGQTYSPPYAPLVMIEEARSERQQLEARIAQLEEHIEVYHSGAELKLSDGGFSFVDTSIGPAPFKWLESTAHGDGTKITVKIGNPTRADWNRIRVHGLAVAKEGTPDQRLSFQSSESVPEGAWKTFKIQIDGIPPNKLEKLFISSFSIENVSLIE